jgi:hypothetical protein
VLVRSGRSDKKGVRQRTRRGAEAAEAGGCFFTRSALLLEVSGEAIAVWR